MPSWSGCCSLVIPEQDWVFLECCVRAPQGESPPLLVSKALGSSMSSVLQHWPWLSIASWVPVASEGGCSLASGEWISFIFYHGQSGAPKSRDPRLGNGRHLLSASAQPDSRMRKNYKQKSPLLYLQVNRVKLFMGFAWWNFFWLGNAGLIKWNITWVCFHLNETCATKSSLSSG